MGSSSPLDMQLQFWNYGQVAMETGILAFSGILAVCIEALPQRDSPSHEPPKCRLSLHPSISLGFLVLLCREQHGLSACCHVTPN